MSNRFRSELESEKFVFTLEAIPPNSKNIVKSLAELDCPIDFVSVVDSPLSRALMNPIIFANHIKEKLNKEVIIHFTCRDRNSIEIKSQLYGAASLGIKNFLALTGDKAVDTKPVFEFISISLIKFMNEVSNKKDLDLFVGGGFNSNARNLHAEFKKAEKKIEAGCRFLMTQPCSDFSRMREITKSLDIPVLHSVLVLSSYEDAVFFQENVPGVVISKELLDVLKSNNQDKITKFYKDMVSELRSFSAGVSFMPYNAFNIVKEIF